MKKFKTYLIENKYLYAILCLAIILVFLPYLTKQLKFVLGYDFQYQHLFFYKDFHRLLHSGQLPFWSHNFFLGTNFWASKAYYILGDPFSYITLLFPSSHLILAMLVTYILKFLTAGILFNHFLIQLQCSLKHRILGVLLYTFCGWATLFAEHPMFLIWHTLLPLLFIGIESVLINKKYTWFTFSIFLLLLSNYYFFFTTSIFLTFYWTIRYYMVKEFHFKNYVIDTLILIGFYLLGVLMASFMIIPAVLHLVKSPRISGSFLLTKKYNPSFIYFDMLVKFFIAPYQVSELGHMLFNTTDYSTNQLTLYSSVFTVLLLPQVLLLKNKKERLALSSLLSILLMFLLTPYGASVMHGLKEPTFRWTLVYIASMIIALMYVLKQPINKKWLYVTAGILSIIILGLRFYAIKRYDVIWDHLKPEYNGLLLALGFIVLYTILLSLKHKYSYLLLVGVLLFEVSYGARKTLHRYPDFQKFEFDQTLDTKAINYIKGLENKHQFYRIYVPYTDVNAPMPFNVNLYYDFKSAYTYDSLYQFDILPFVRDKLNITWTTWQLDIQDIDLLRQLGFKYYMVKQPNFSLGQPRYSKGMYDLTKDSKFEFLTSINDYSIYIDHGAKPFPLEINELKDNHIYATITSKPKHITLPIAYDAGWSLTINKHKQTITNDQGFLGFDVLEGNNEVHLSFIPRGFLLGSILSLLSFNVFIFILYKTKKRIQ